MALFTIRVGNLAAILTKKQFVVKKWLIFKNVILCNQGDNVVAYISQTVNHWKMRHQLWRNVAHFRSKVKLFFCGIDVHKSSWKVHLRHCHRDLDKFSMNPSPKGLADYLKKNYPVVLCWLLSEKPTTPNRLKIFSTCWKYLSEYLSSENCFQ